MPIEPLPLPAIPPAPSRADPATFEERNDAAVEFQFNVLPPWIAGQVQRTFDNALESADNATLAETARVAAESAADAASQIAGAAQWVSGQTYDVGEAVYSTIDFQTYRRRVAGSGTLDPSLDPANWQQIGGVMQGGSASLSRYDLASLPTAEVLDLHAAQVFRIDASTPRTVSFVNEPGTDRAMVVVIHIAGNSAITWPATIVWDDDAPDLGDSFTRVVLMWDGVEWTGFQGAAR